MIRERSQLAGLEGQVEARFEQAAFEGKSVSGKDGPNAMLDEGRGKVLFAENLVYGVRTRVFRSIQAAPRNESDNRVSVTRLSNAIDVGFDIVAFVEIEEKQVEAAGLQHGAALVEGDAALQLVFVQSRPLQIGSKRRRIVFVGNNSEKEKRPANSLNRGLACVDVVWAVGRLGSRHSVDAIGEAEFWSRR